MIRESIERWRRAVTVELAREMVVVFACGAAIACHPRPPNMEPPNVERRLLDASPEERHVLRMKTRYWNWLDGVLFAVFPPPQFIGPTDVPVFPVAFDGAERRYGGAVIEHVFLPYGYGVRPVSRRTLLAWPLDRSTDEAFRATTEVAGAPVRYELPTAERNVALDLLPPPATLHLSPTGMSELDPMISKAVGRVGINGRLDVELVEIGRACSFNAATYGDPYARAYRMTTCTHADYEIAVSAEIAASGVAEPTRFVPGPPRSHLEIRRRRVPGVRLTHMCESQNFFAFGDPCLNWFSFWRDPDQYAAAAGFDLRAVQIASESNSGGFTGPLVDVRTGTGGIVSTPGNIDAVARYEVRLAANGQRVAKGILDLRSYSDHQVATIVQGMRIGGRRIALLRADLFVPTLNRFTVVVVDVELTAPEGKEGPR